MASFEADLGEEIQKRDRLSCVEPVGERCLNHRNVAGSARLCRKSAVPDVPEGGNATCLAGALVPSSSRTLGAKISRESTPPPRAASPAAISTSSVPVTTGAALQEGSEVYINGWRETHRGQLLPGTDMTGAKGVVATVIPDSHCSVRVGFNLHCIPDEKLQSGFVPRPSIFG